MTYETSQNARFRSPLVLPTSLKPFSSQGFWAWLGVLVSCWGLGVLLGSWCVFGPGWGYWCLAGVLVSCWGLGACWGLGVLLGPLCLVGVLVWSGGSCDNNAAYNICYGFQSGVISERMDGVISNRKDGVISDRNLRTRRQNGFTKNGYCGGASRSDSNPPQ
jgi:hypothetical protein